LAECEYCGAEIKSTAKNHYRVCPKFPREKLLSTRVKKLLEEFPYLDYAAVAAKAGTTRAVATAYAYKFGLRRGTRTLSVLETKKAIAFIVNTDRSYAWIARQFDITRQAVWEIAKRHGVQDHNKRNPATGAALARQARGIV
jgi:hypothetical protein